MESMFSTVLNASVATMAIWRYSCSLSKPIDSWQASDGEFEVEPGDKKEDWNCAASVSI